MLRGLLRDSEAAKELFEKVGLFKSPELLEKYVVASEVTVEVLGMFWGCCKGCKSLRRVTFGPSSSLERIGARCFYRYDLVELEIPDSVIINPTFIS